MSENNSHQLIYDLIDGQLSPDEIERAQQLIADDEEIAALYHSLRDQQKALKALPSYTLDDSFADRVVELAQTKNLINSKNNTEIVAHKPSSSQSASSVSPTSTSRTKSRMDWRGPVATLAALAATILAAMFIFPNLIDNSPFSVAQKEAVKTSKSEAEEAGAEAAPTATDPTDSKAKSAVGQFESEDTALGAGPPNKNAAPQNGNSEGSIVKSAGSSDDRSDRENLRQEKELANVEATPSRSGGMGAAKRLRKTENLRDSESLGAIDDVKGGADEESAMPKQIVNADSLKDSVAMNNSMMEQSAQPAVAGPDGNDAKLMMGKVLIIEIQQNAESFKRVNDVFAENDVEVELPLTTFDEFEKQAEASDGQQSVAGVQPDGLSDNGKGFAFTVRTTPKQMQDAILKLGNVAQIRGVNLNQQFPGNKSIADQQLQVQEGGNSIDGFDSINRLEVADLGRNGVARGIHPESAEKGFGSRNFGSGFGGGGGFGGEPNESEGDEQNESEELSAESDSRIADVNRFLGLDEDFGQEDSSNQTFALVFVFKDLNSESPAEPAAQVEPMIDAGVPEDSGETKGNDDN